MTAAAVGAWKGALIEDGRGQTEYDDVFEDENEKEAPMAALQDPSSMVYLDQLPVDRDTP